MLDNEPQSAYACPAVGTHYADVCVPVTVKPFAIPGPVTVECCGEPIMTNEGQCRGKVGAVCHFTIAQKIKIEVPIDFGAAVKVGDTYVECDHFAVEPGNPHTPPSKPGYPGPNHPGQGSPEPSYPNYPAPNYPGPNSPDNGGCGCAESSKF